MAFLEINGVVNRFLRYEVLRGLSLNVEQHQVVCLIGPSGCGKSTLLRCINGLEEIQEGEIRLHGDRVSGPGVDVNSLRRDVGIVFQSFNLFPPPRRPTTPPACRAASSSASPSCAPWPWTRCCCCSTKSPRRSTPSSSPR